MLFSWYEVAPRRVEATSRQWPWHFCQGHFRSVRFEETGAKRIGLNATCGNREPKRKDSDFNIFGPLSNEAGNPGQQLFWFMSNRRLKCVLLESASRWCNGLSSAWEVRATEK